METVFSPRLSLQCQQVDKPNSPVLVFCFCMAAHTTCHPSSMNSNGDFLSYFASYVRRVEKMTNMSVRGL